MPEKNITETKLIFGNGAYLESRCFIWRPFGRKSTFETLWNAFHHPNHSFWETLNQNAIYAAWITRVRVAAGLRPNGRPLKGFPDLSSKIRRFNDRFSVYFRICREARPRESTSPKENRHAWLKNHRGPYPANRERSAKVLSRLWTNVLPITLMECLFVIWSLKMVSKLFIHHSWNFFSEKF